MKDRSQYSLQKTHTGRNYRNLLASLSVSRSVRISPSLTGPFTFLMIDRLLSSRNSTLTYNKFIQTTIILCEVVYSSLLNTHTHTNTSAWMWGLHLLLRIPYRSWYQMKVQWRMLYSSAAPFLLICQECGLHFTIMIFTKESENYEKRKYHVPQKAYLGTLSLWSSSAEDLDHL